MNKKTIIIIIIAGIIAIGAGIGVAVLVHNLTGGNNSKETQTPENREQMTTKAADAYNAALVAINSSDKEEAQKQLDIAYKYYKDIGDEAGIENVEAQFDIVKAIPDPVPPTIVNTQ